jgi:hypothetical protein
LRVAAERVIVGRTKKDDKEVWVKVPDDVTAWIRGVFRTCNARTASSLMRMPTTHEETLDAAFVGAAAEFAAPVRFQSEWIVRIDTHFLGGRRHFYNWEIADIGVLIVFRRGGKVVRSKVVLLQSKRLYPDEEEYDEKERIDYEIGFARLFRGDARFEAVSAPRVFAFQETSRYQALKVGDDQFSAIEQYESSHGIPVHYLLYHPGVVPFSTEIPRLPANPPTDTIEVASRPPGYSPQFSDVKAIELSPPAPTSTRPGWLVEEFIADLALQCKVGHVAEKENDPGLVRVFSRRSGPISAAIAITFDAPPGWKGE